MNSLSILIPKLSQDYNITITTTDYFIPDHLIQYLDSLIKKNLINKYFIIPVEKKIKTFNFLKLITNELRSNKFDYWLTSGETEVHERYILEFILPKHCMKIILSCNLTYLFQKPEIVKSLLYSVKNIEEKAPLSHKQMKDVSFYYHKLKDKCEEKDITLIKGLLFYLGMYINNTYKRLVKKNIRYVDRILIAFMMCGKTFRLGPYDDLTILSSGRSDVIIFCDSIEAKAHKSLYPKSKICVAQYPTYGSCSCNGIKTGDPIILSPLSGFEGTNSISDRWLELFLRDFRTVVSQTKVKNIHLRLHPRETGKWPYQLKDYLNNHGLKVDVVDCNKRFDEITCNYIGVVGYGSGSLRDARACCDYVFVVGFVALSLCHFSYPKFVFGNSEGIDWINEDGSYDPKIFESKKFIPPKRKTVPEILNELSKKQSIELGDYISYS